MFVSVDPTQKQVHPVPGATGRLADLRKVHSDLQQQMGARTRSPSPVTRVSLASHRPPPSPTLDRRPDLFCFLHPAQQTNPPDCAFLPLSLLRPLLHLYFLSPLFVPNSSASLAKNARWLLQLLSHSSYNPPLYPHQLRIGIVTESRRVALANQILHKTSQSAVPGLVVQFQLRCHPALCARPP